MISDPDAEDHPWIKHQSFIAYQHCTELDRTRILNEHFHGEIIMKEDITDELLQRIQNGAKKTKFLALKYKKYFQFF